MPASWTAEAGRAAAAVVLAGVGVGVVWVAASNHASPPPVPPGGSHNGAQASSRTPAPAPSQRSASAPPGGVEDHIVGPVLAESPPVAIRIPSLGVRSKLMRLGLDGAGSMEVPHDPALAGWYTLGPTPGALGPAVIAGHVTWDLQPAVFYRLGALRSGDRVRVRRRDGKTAVFQVRRVMSFAKTRFPTQAVFGATDRAALRLITCGGTYDELTHSYLDNVVVFATLASVRSS